MVRLQSLGQPSKSGMLVTNSGLFRCLRGLCLPPLNTTRKILQTPRLGALKVSVCFPQNITLWKSFLIADTVAHVCVEYAHTYTLLTFVVHYAVQT